MKLLIVLAVIISLTSQLKWDNINLKSELRGNWNPE